jgi:hypothetical protein
MGPVAQRVFKTRAVVQPTARSVRLRRRSVTPSAAEGLASVALREDAAAGGDRGLPRKTPVVLSRAGDEQDERHHARDQQGDEELLHSLNVDPRAVVSSPLFGSESHVPHNAY